MSELVQYMEQNYLYSNTAPELRLAELTMLVENCMTSLGVQFEERPVNQITGELKEQLMSLIPRLREYKVGGEVVLSFEPHVADAICEACQYDDTTDGK